MSVTADAEDTCRCAQEQQQYWREAANGLGSLPYFLGNTFVDLYYVVLAPALFVGPYWNLTLPRTGVLAYYLVAAATVWWSSGVAYAISALLPPGSTLVATVFLCLVVGAFVSGLEPTVAAVRGGVYEWVLSLSYSRCEHGPELVDACAVRVTDSTT